MAVVIPFSPADATIDRLVDLVTPDMQRVNAQILTRTGWARSVAGAGPYLTLFSRGRVSRGDADAAHRVHAAGYQRADAYSPFPIHGLAEALGFHENKVQKFVFLGGVAGRAREDRQEDGHPDPLEDRHADRHADRHRPRSPSHPPHSPIGPPHAARDTSRRTAPRGR